MAENFITVKLLIINRVLFDDVIINFMLRLRQRLHRVCNSLSSFNVTTEPNSESSIDRIILYSSQ